jgi:CDP-diacylglycerol---glycerol-3-phosphate 3-phosphatidyltransferase
MCKNRTMSLYTLKPRFQALLRPLVLQLHAAGITANQVTVIACALSVALALLIVALPERAWLFLLVPLWLAVRMALNAIDGMLAREFGQASALGAILNELGDVISDAVLYLPFAFIAGSNPWLLAMVILLAMLSEFAGVLGVMVGASRRYDGPMGKSDRAVVFGFIGLLAGLSLPLSVYVNWVWIGVAMLTVITIANRVRGALAERHDKGNA